MQDEISRSNTFVEISTAASNVSFLELFNNNIKYICVNIKATVSNAFMIMFGNSIINT